MDTEFFRYLASLGVGGLIAGLIFMAYRKDVKFYHDQWKGMSEALMQVVKENTIAVTSNTEISRAFHDRLDDVEREGRVRRRP